MLFHPLALQLTPYRFFTHRSKMPFKSQAQRKFMYSQHPEMAKEWEDKTPKGKKLPKKVKKKNGKTKG
jgi:hypothetical protein